VIIHRASAQSTPCVGSSCLSSSYQKQPHHTTAVESILGPFYWNGDVPPI
jgi:hypothetical protein